MAVPEAEKLIFKKTGGRMLKFRCPSAEEIKKVYDQLIERIKSVKYENDSYTFNRTVMRKLRNCIFHKHQQNAGEGKSEAGKAIQKKKERSAEKQVPKAEEAVSKNLKMISKDYRHSKNNPRKFYGYLYLFFHFIVPVLDLYFAPDDELYVHFKQYLIYMLKNNISSDKSKNCFKVRKGSLLDDLIAEGFVSIETCKQIVESVNKSDKDNKSYAASLSNQLMVFKLFVEKVAEDIPKEEAFKEHHILFSYIVDDSTPVEENEGRSPAKKNQRKRAAQPQSQGS
jgi:hypothetical protein